MELGLQLQTLVERSVRTAERKREDRENTVQYQLELDREKTVKYHLERKNIVQCQLERKNNLQCQLKRKSLFSAS